MKFLSALLLAATFLPVPAWAHGGEEHDKKIKAAISDDQHDFGREGDPKQVSRTIQISMDDTMRYSPDKLTVKQGETIRLVLTNKGKLMHELVLGSARKLQEHAEVMKKFPDMEHDEPYMAHVPPAKQQVINWQFNQPGEFLFGCLIPGHFEAGMVGRITVVSHTPADATQALTDGEVKKVDPEQKKITIKHGEIANLGMPPMTMVFKVSDPALLASAKPGDKIRFSVEKRTEGFVVTRIQPADAAQ